MTSYDLSVHEVNFQMVPVHHVLQELTRTFGSKLLVEAIQRFEKRDEYIANDPERFTPRPEHVLQ
jgi:hypothetical protein